MGQCAGHLQIRSDNVTSCISDIPDLGSLIRSGALHLPFERGVALPFTMAWTNLPAVQVVCLESWQEWRARRSMQCLSHTFLA